MIIKKNIIITSLALCTLHTHAASNSFPQSLATRHSVPITIGTVVGYVIGNQLDHNLFGPVSLTCAAMGTFAGAKLDTFLSKNKMAPLLVVNNKLEYTKTYKAPADQKQNIETQISSQPHRSEFEKLKTALYLTKGDGFKYWFESRYKNTDPTKKAAWGLYWQINDKILHITNQQGNLQTVVHVGDQRIELTDIIWQDMLSIKSRILKHEAESGSLQR